MDFKEIIGNEGDKTQSPRKRARTEFASEGAKFESTSEVTKFEFPRLKFESTSEGAKFDFPSQKAGGTQFTIKKFNLHAMWSWDVQCDTCGICKNSIQGEDVYTLVMDLCLMIV